MDMLQRPNILLSGIEPKNLITLTYQNRNMNGPGLFMEMSKKKFQTTTLLDANLLHDIVTGKSLTAVLHFVNNNLTDWFSKRQATVETTT